MLSLAIHHYWPTTHYHHCRQWPKNKNKPNILPSPLLVQHHHLTPVPLRSHQHRIVAIDLKKDKSAISTHEVVASGGLLGFLLLLLFIFGYWWRWCIAADDVSGIFLMEPVKVIGSDQWWWVGVDGLNLFYFIFIYSRKFI